MNNNKDVRVYEAPTCLICGSNGRLLCENQHDRLFTAPGLWSLMLCPECDLIWLNPQPISEEIGSLYKTYYTHNVTNNRPKFAKLKKFLSNSIIAAELGYTELANSKIQRVLGHILSWARPIKEIAVLSVGSLDGHNKGTLLEIGCGSGAFLARMRELGWDVVGVEPDADAVTVARRSFGLNIYHGALQNIDFHDNNFDAIIMHHVIEHLSDPIDTLQECHRVLKPGGRLIIVTPNIRSIGHRLFKETWRGLEVPRHLFLFSPRSLKICAEMAGFHVKMLKTTAQSARGIWAESRFIQKNGALPDGSTQLISLYLKIQGMAFQILEHVLLAFQRDIGEEIVLIVTK